MEGKFGNLKDYVLSGRKGGSCKKGALVTFLSQVASALDYLHTMHIVHGNLRAEHVIVESSNQVRSSLFVKAFLHWKLQKADSAYIAAKKILCT